MKLKALIILFLTFSNIACKVIDEKELNIIYIKTLGPQYCVRHVSFAVGNEINEIYVSTLFTEQCYGCIRWLESIKCKEIEKK